MKSLAKVLKYIGNLHLQTEISFQSCALDKALQNFAIHSNAS